VSVAWQFYFSTLLIYLAVNVMAVWGLNLQFGVAGISSFAFIVFQAAGAYTAGVLTLGPSTKASFQQYVGGANLPFPLPVIAAGLVGGLLAGLVGLVGIRRLRTDYQAMVMLVISLTATYLADNQTNVVNGPAGLSLVPKPLEGGLGLSTISYQWFYVGLAAAFCLIIYWFVHRYTNSPLGRATRAVRDNEQAAAALGKNVFGLRMIAFVAGGVIAGISGAVFVEFIGAWSPGSWLYPETFVLFTAILVGGTGNNVGVAVGALLVPIGFLESTRFLPNIGYPGFVDALQWIAVGVLALIFLWFWPRGVIPERKRRFLHPGEKPAGLAALRLLRLRR
jgi:ABC-type branched-subunit amino acid transport system permease subunit